MKGKYTKPDGETVIVDSFDEVNKIVSVEIASGRYKHYGENEYKDWVSETPDEDIEEKKTVKKPKKK